MKKFLAALLVYTVAIGFIACQEDQTTQESIVDLSDDAEVFTVEALSAASLLDYSSVSTLSYIPLAEETTEEGTDLVESEIDEVDKYLAMVETYLGDNNALSIVVLESDRAEFANLIKFTTVDAFGNQVEYLLYYNETIYEDDTDDVITTEEPVTTEEQTTTEEAVTTEEPATTEEPTTVEETTTVPLAAQEPKDFNFHDEDDDYVVYSLTGIIVKGDVEYSVEGKKVVNEDGSTVTRLRAFVDQDNFVKVAYQEDAEDGNTKFFYEVKEDGVIVNKSRVHVVEQDGATVVHLSFVDEVQTAKYTFKVIEEEGVTLIHVMYDIRLLADGTRETGNIHITVTIDPETQEAIYSYKILGREGTSNGSTYKKIIEKRHGRPEDNNMGSKKNNM